VTSDIFRKMRLWQFAAGIALACAVIAAEKASADITDAAPNGFTLSETAHIAASSDKVYAALITPKFWWSPQHTFSHDPANLTLDARAGGCWCETLPGGGSVLHLTVVFAAPGKMLRLIGGMGPFQAMAVNGVMTWTLKPNGDGTDVAITYAVGGYTPGGFTGIEPVADRVFGEQLSRLKTYVETGSLSSLKEMKP